MFIVFNPFALRGVTESIPVLVGAPTFSGTAKIGQTLTGTDGT